MDYKLSADFIFLGEGAADNALMKALSEKRGLRGFDYPFPGNIRDEKGKTIGGKDRFGEMLTLLEPVIQSQGRTRGILIAVDCGDDWQKSFDYVAKQIGTVAIEGQNLYPRPKAPLQLVSALPAFAHLPPLVIVMVPGVGKTGGMETLCVEVLRDKHPNTALCLDGYLACLTEKGVGIGDWDAEPRGKAEMQCLIATTNRDDPNKAGRYAIEAGLIDVAHSTFDDLTADLKTAVDALPA